MYLCHLGLRNYAWKTRLLSFYMEKWMYAGFWFTLHHLSEFRSSTRSRDKFDICHISFAVFFFQVIYIYIYTFQKVSNHFHLTRWYSLYLSSLYFDTTPDLFLWISHGKIHKSRHGDEGFAVSVSLHCRLLVFSLSSAFCCHSGPQKTEDKRRRCVSCTHTLPVGDQTQADVLCYCWHESMFMFCGSGTFLLVFRSLQVTDEMRRTDSQPGRRRGKNDIWHFCLFKTCIAILCCFFTASPKANQRYSNAVTPSQSSSAEFSKRASQMHRVIWYVQISSQQAQSLPHFYGFLPHLQKEALTYRPQSVGHDSLVQYRKLWLALRHEPQSHDAHSRLP